jgi:hypothetical protein
MVRAHGVTKTDNGGQSNIRFVGGTDSVDVLADLTEQCIDHYLEQTKAAYCYAYGSDIDYELKTFDWAPEFDESAFGGSRPCWVYHGGQPISGAQDRGVKMTSGIEYLLANCPGTIAYPDEDGSLAAERTRKAQAQAAAQASRPRNPCALVDTSALERYGFKSVLGDVTGGDPTSYLPDGATASYGCQNSELELIFTVNAYPAADLATSSVTEGTPQPDDFLLKDGGFVIDIPGGWAVINESFGSSEARWSTGSYELEVTLNSMPVVPGTDIGQPAADLVDTVNDLARAANDRIAADNW